MKHYLLAGAIGTLAGAVVATQFAGPLVAQESGKNASIYEQLDLFGNVFERVRADYVEQVDDKTLIEAAINGMLTSLDPHSSYMAADDFDDMQVQTRGEFGGLGIEVTMENEVLKVAKPIRDTPASKAGIAALTLVAATEMDRYGVTANAIAPSARTRMTETVFADMMATQDQAFDAMAPENISPLVVWLGSVESRDVTGKVFELEGGKIRVAEGWAHGPEIDKGAKWDPAELGPVVADLLAKARPAVPVYGS